MCRNNKLPTDLVVVVTQYLIFAVERVNVRHRAAHLSFPCVLFVIQLILHVLT
jgi:hypothetical protein